MLYSLAKAAVKLHFYDDTQPLSRIMYCRKLDVGAGWYKKLFKKIINKYGKKPVIYL